MKHLFDTCTLLNELSQPNRLLNVMSEVNNKNDDFLVPNIVVDELEINSNLSKEQIVQSQGIINTLECGCKQYKNTDIISIYSNDIYRKNFEEIRFKFYFHVSQKELIRRVKSNEITKEQAKHLRKKDYGECACIAIAITKSSDFIIISEDDGRIVEFPKKNIFEIYKKSHGIRVYKFIAWKDMMQLAS